MLIPAADRAQERARAPEKSPVIGLTDGGRWELERVDFIHYAKSENPAKAPKAPSCFKLLGPKWQAFPVNYVVNPTNSGLADALVTAALASSTETWDAQTATELFADNSSVDNSAVYGQQDFVNAVAFGNYTDPNVIAVTSIWYIPRGRRIVEFDMLFDTDWTWGDATATPEAMDLQNIATHEFGHSFGLGDIYDGACSAVTMFGYSDYGETTKRTLEQPDITGVQKLYGGL